MSSQPVQSVSPPPGQASSANSGVRRHHTISAASRGSRPTSKIQVSEQDEAEQEEVWSQDEIVDQDWRGGIGAVGEKASLHRQASLPTKYHRGELNVRFAISPRSFQTFSQHLVSDQQPAILPEL